jgi:hypothetical protein
VGHDHEFRIPRQPHLTRSLMRFRANVEDVGSFFSKSLWCIFRNDIDNAFDFLRDHTSDREIAEEVHYQVYRVPYAHYL